jgi:hypothetical protein
VDLPDKEIPVATVNFGVGNVDHVLVDVEIHLKQIFGQFLAIIQPNEYSQISGTFLLYQQSEDCGESTGFEKKTILSIDIEVDEKIG